ncbi:MAG: SPFH domain-containing protein [Actinomycetota bacterium]|nr:SPFH domain-containing protein [Actinomycetota bacterium]
MSTVIIVLLAVFFLLMLIIPSLRRIGQTEIGLVSKRFSIKKLSDDNPVAFRGEAGYQADLLMPGIRWKFWILYKVGKFPWVQVAPGEIGVVIAQVGKPLPIGAKSAEYQNVLGNFSDISSFVENGGQKGVQRPVLPPGTNAPIHPVGFLVITRSQVYGVPVTPELQSYIWEHGSLTPEAFGLSASQLGVRIIQPAPAGPGGEMIDMVGVVTTYEGDPLPAGDIASRLGGFSDIEEAEDRDAPDLVLIETLLGTKNGVHNNYQDYQAFLDNGGRIGLQHDPLLYGAYNLNPFLVSVELVPMLVVEQGQVAVIKAYVGLATIDTSGTEFKFGSLVRPGHRGIWEEPLRTGKYPINPRCYQAEIVPTEIITLNWAEASSEAHKLDRQLKQIIGKSREGFVFAIDLQVQIHVPDTRAPKVISMVGTMQNLVNEVLQAAVGNHFRDTLQSMRAVDFIEKRQQVQEDAFDHIKDKLEDYEVVTRGVYIQDVVFPQEMVDVLTQREIANQEIDTYRKQKEAQEQRIQTEAAEGTADMQKELARSAVGVDINKNDAVARKAEADGEATYIKETGAARGAEVEAVGMARAKAYQAQVMALGKTPTALVNAIDALSDSGQRFVPDILVSGGGANTLEALAAQIMGVINRDSTGAAAGEGIVAVEEDSGITDIPETPETPEGL